MGQGSSGPGSTTPPTDLLSGSVESVPDSLTATLTRAELGEHFGGLDPGRVTLIAVDLDNFKMFNEVAGRTRGDEALQEVARRLIETAASRAVVARVGGDEFFVLSDTLTVDEARTMASSIEGRVASTPILQAEPPYVPSREEWQGVPWYCHFYGPTDDQTYVLGCGDWAPPPVFPLPLADTPPRPPWLRISGIYLAVSVVVIASGQPVLTLDSIWREADEQMGQVRQARSQNRLENWRARSGDS